MSDVTPKLKLYVFISIIFLIFNMGVFCLKENLDVGQLALSSGSSFIPFISLINLAFLNVPTEVMIFIALITGILSAIQTFILTMVLLQIASNVIWHPDV